ncbi:MAG: tetratricopeptide repeat-containing sensor histidine kinase [Bacteroidetes bacterium]|nr:tetratricopeptide repeat-containing sensor histidine kinase [Bacteroidota bacterium]MBS1541278.1 tetratricopeptide repeat-containing sensor histidine kinase [Bacteroidota bacterium]
MRPYLFLQLLTVSFLLTINNLPAQVESRIDSAKKILQYAKGDERFMVLNKLFKLSNTSNYAEALQYAEAYYQLALSHGDSAKIIQGGRMCAYSLIDLTRYEEASKILTSILEIAVRNQNSNPEIKNQIKFILNNAGLVNTYIGNYDKALEYHFKSLEIREKEGDKRAIRYALNNIGLVYHNITDDENAIVYYLKVIALCKELKDYTNMEGAYVNIGLSYNQVGKFQDAIKSFDEGFRICGGKCSDNIIKEGYVGLGFAYLSNGQNDLAKEKFLKSLEISKKQNDARYICENLSYLGKISLNLKEEDHAEAYFAEALKLAEAHHITKVKITVYKELSEYYRSKKDYQKSLAYQNKYSILKDSVFREGLIKNIARVQTNYAERENIKTIAEKNQTVALQKEVITRQQRQYYFIFAITCLIVLLAALLLYFTKRQQKINQELSLAKNIIEDQNRKLEEKVVARTQDLIRSNQALLQSNEDLDYFIYKTSHDIRGPLVTMKGMCNIAHMDLKDQLALSYFSKLDLTVDRLNIILTRLQMVNNINTSMLKAIPINFNIIIDEIQSFEQKKGLPPRFQFSYEIKPECKVTSDYLLIKTLLENLIDNAIKFHNNSERVDPFVKILITRAGENTRIIVEDNGIGIDIPDTKDIFKMFVRASERSEIGGLGLYLSKLATEKLGGTITLQKTDSKGSTFEVVFPSVLPPHISIGIAHNKYHTQPDQSAPSIL